MLLEPFVIGIIAQGPRKMDVIGIIGQGPRKIGIIAIIAQGKLV